MKVAMPSQYNTIQLVQAQLDTIKSEEIPPPKKKTTLTDWGYKPSRCKLHTTQNWILVL